MNPQKIISEFINDSRQIKEKFFYDNENFVICARQTATRLIKGGRILLASSMEGKILCEYFASVNYNNPSGKPALPVMNLTSDASFCNDLTGPANSALIKQLETLACPGDILITFLLSASSEDFIYSLQEAAGNGLYSIILSSNVNNALFDSADNVFMVDSGNQKILFDTFLCFINIFFCLLEYYLYDNPLELSPSAD